MEGKVEGAVTEQTHRIFDSIEAILAESRLTLSHVVKATVWLSDPRDFSAFNAVYARRFAQPYPVRSCVISQLVLPSACVEIEVVASRRHRRI